jgi:hypothetical protein
MDNGLISNRAPCRVLLIFKTSRITLGKGGGEAGAILPMPKKYNCSLAAWKRKACVPAEPLGERAHGKVCGPERRKKLPPDARVLKCSPITYHDPKMKRSVTNPTP